MILKIDTFLVPIVVTIILAITLANAYDVSCDCGRRNTKRIIGGKETGANEYPWMVSLVYHNFYIHVCGGTIITQWHVLTATHCTNGHTFKEILLCVEAHDVTKCKEEYNKKVKEKIYKLSKIIDYASFNSDKKTDDISILVTKNKIRFSQLVSAVCFPHKTYSDDLDREILKAMGWGNVPNYNNLREIDANVIPHEKCKEGLKILDQSRTQICIKSAYGRPYTRDSGGPVVWYDPDIERYTLVGIISYVPIDTDSFYSSVNTDVSAYRDWVNKNVKGSCNLLGKGRKGTLCMKTGNP